MTMHRSDEEEEEDDSFVGIEATLRDVIRKVGLRSRGQELGLGSGVGSQRP